MLHILILLFAYGGSSHAQYQQFNWLNIAYTYTDFAYKEPGVMSEKAQLAGVRGEVGFNFFHMFAVSARGEYQDGHLNYDGATFSGAPVKQVTNDYIRDLRAMAHLVYAPVVLSYGIADRYWYDNLVISYRRRTQYRYSPLILSYFFNNAYVSFEHDLWGKGTNTSHMSDVNPAAHDVDFTLGAGTGFGVEIGYMIPNPLVATHFYFSYHKWSVKQSDIQSDGTQNLIEPDNNTTTIQAGIGVAF